MVLSFIPGQIGLSDRGGIARDLSGMFCHLTNSLQYEFTSSPVNCSQRRSNRAKITAIAVILAVVAMLVYEGGYYAVCPSQSYLLTGLTIFVLYRNWSAFQRLRVRANNDISLPLIIRVTIFSFLPMVAMG